MIKERLAQLREKMAEQKVDLYMVTSSDFHGSEYVGDYFKERAFITGFTGSAGTAVITADEAFLWTDGRYFIQAAEQLKGSSVTLMKMGQEGVPTVEAFILSRMGKGMTLGFDGRTVPAATGSKYREQLAEKGASVNASLDLVGDIWENRPELPAEPVFLLDEKYAGQPRAEKLANLRAEMEKQGAGYHALTVLDDIAWLLNIRGGDVAYNPVVLSYLLVGPHAVLEHGASVEQKTMVQRSVRACPAVREVDSRLEASDQQSVCVRLRVNFAPDAVLPEVSSQIQRDVKDYIQSHAGVPVSEVQIFVEAVGAPQPVRVE